MYEAEDAIVEQLKADFDHFLEKTQQVKAMRADIKGDAPWHIVFMLAEISYLKANIDKIFMCLRSLEGDYKIAAGIQKDS